MISLFALPAERKLLFTCINYVKTKRELLLGNQSIIIWKSIDIKQKMTKLINELEKDFNQRIKILADKW